VGGRPGPLISWARPLRWTVPVVLGACLVTVAVGWRWLGPGAPTPEGPGMAPGGKPAPAHFQALDPLAFVQARVDTSNSTNLTELVQAYGHWASRRDAVPARRAIVSTLLGHERMEVGLQLLLTAVEGDSTPRAQDPMWATLVQQVGRLWDERSFRQGRDLLQIETRPRAKDLLLESLARIRPEQLAPDQRPLLASDLIDMYGSLPPDQKPLVERALHALSGSDVVDILSGRGLAASGRAQARAAERRRAIDGIKRTALREQPPEP
jgi:hypothetical protein